MYMKARNSYKLTFTLSKSHSDSLCLVLTILQYMSFYY